MFVSRLLDFQKTRYARFMNHRVPSNCRYQPTEYEHAANCATHAFWILPSILGSSILYILSDDQWETISAWIYGFGLSSLFIVSTIFHTISWKKRHLRTVEHCLHMFDRMVIYFFIAASYAPWLNLRELGPWASHMRWIIWIMASIGTVYVFFFHERYKLVELVCYVIMGFFPALVILSMVLWVPGRHRVHLSQISFLGCLEIVGSQNRRMVWFGRDLKDHLVPFLLGLLGPCCLAGEEGAAEGREVQSCSWTPLLGGGGERADTPWPH
ncbi:monocyte to macrophage differentiation factor 2 isoform X1 [Motacilla alba alba]|uniref:monocyte to macrophage differentiation factor 2 isoform X1 n=1 Tax=Motacilla alba alba TaxID=1094192 RepID=UPI0018D4FE88|nr:monocyte to macrophage differentiation factor 2 isoform X1 [Motacilla alba alba]